MGLVGLSGVADSGRCSLKFSGAHHQHIAVPKLSPGCVSLQLFSCLLFPLNMSAAAANKTEGTMTLKCMLKPKYSCEDQSGRRGTGASRLSFRVVIFISYL